MSKPSFFCMAKVDSELRSGPLEYSQKHAISEHAFKTGLSNDPRENRNTQH